MILNIVCQTCGGRVYSERRQGVDKIRALYCSQSCAAQLNGILSPKRGKVSRYKPEREDNGMYKKCVQCGVDRSTDYDTVFCSDSCRESFWIYEMSLYGKNGKSKKTSVCDKCLTPIDYRSRYCNSCKVSSNVRIVDINNCPDCGNSVARDRVFCKECYTTRQRTRTTGSSPKPRSKNRCVDCATEISHTSTRCKPCDTANRRKDSHLSKWLKGDDVGYRSNPFVLPNGVRDYLLSEADYMCTKCRFDTKHPDGSCILEINHIDGNASNHVKSNLEVLCPNCHALTDNYRSRNRGNGRFYNAMS